MKSDKLKLEAWEQLNMCCQTLCDRESVKKYIMYLESQIKREND